MVVSHHQLYSCLYHQAIADTNHQILQPRRYLRAWHAAVHALSSLVATRSSMVEQACASKDRFLCIRPLLSHLAYLSLEIVDPTLY